MPGAGFDSVRLAVGLAHAVPDAEIRLAAPVGSDLSVSSNPGADIDICRLQQLVASSTCASQPDVSRWIRITEIRGSIRHCGGGIYRTCSETDEQRWFATLLTPGEVIDILRRLESRERIAPGVDALLKPDLALGVTAVCLSVGDPAAGIDIDDAAEAAHSACMVSELLRCTSAVRR